MFSRYSSMRLGLYVVIVVALDIMGISAGVFALALIVIVVTHVLYFILGFVNLYTIADSNVNIRHRFFHLFLENLLLQVP